MAARKCNVVIAGGGLAGCLIALALAGTRPERDVVLVEKDRMLGGNHIWSFFAGDIAPRHSWLVAPLICHGWPGHEVRFRDYSRKLEGRYYSVESERLDRKVRDALPPGAILTGRKVLACSPRTAVLNDGTRLEADVVIDTRGQADFCALDCGWQKFVGQLLETEEPHGFTRPVIMDATVAQHDGYRFVYCLPFSPVRLFVEDTYYSNDSELDALVLRARIEQWADANGLQRPRVLREEKGVLPVVTGGDIDAHWRAGGPRIAKAGVRGGFFHPLTSYSLPDAVRVAMAIAESESFGAQAMNDKLHKLSRDHWRRTKFYRTLAKLLLHSGRPEDRHQVFGRFYSLSEPLISRFYAGQSTATDKVRIMSGKPPVPVGEALKVLVTDGARG